MSNKVGLIEKECILVVEGKNDRNVLLSLCKYLHIEELLHVFFLEGKIDLPGLNAILNLSDFHTKVKSFGVIRDADDDPSRAFQSVVTFFAKLNLPQPKRGGEFASNAKIKTGIFILPDNNGKGELETIVAKALEIEHSARMECVDSCLKCMQSKGVDISKADKARVHTYIGASEKPELTIGEAAEACMWTWDGSIFNNLKKFLSTLSSPVLPVSPS
ncbi:MAG: hypothetical protein NTZ95_03955 [Candidatus Omnitrophica bacterium]|nr:hypothetical protein [Candidatus Omnitrophota bacterium]